MLVVHAALLGVEPEGTGGIEGDSEHQGHWQMVRPLMEIRCMERRGPWNQHVGLGMHSGIWMFGDQWKHKTVLSYYEFLHVTKDTDTGNLYNYITD